MLSYCVLVILWGAYVRSSGSGAGCGRHWPLCNGEVVPPSMIYKTVVEYTHRLSSGLSLLSVLLLFFWARKIAPKKHFIRSAAGWALFAMLLEAILGAGLVLFKLVEHDESIQRVVSIAVHLVNTLFLTAAITITAEAPSLETPRWRMSEPLLRKKVRLFLWGFIFLASMGAITALGDTLFKPSSLSAGWASDWQANAHVTERIRILHPMAAVLWLALLLPWLLELKEMVPGISRRIWFAVGFACLNLALGALNILLLAPIWLQTLHLLVANLLWISLVRSFFFAASKWSSH